MWRLPCACRNCSKQSPERFAKTGRFEGKSMSQKEFRVVPVIELRWEGALVGVVVPCDPGTCGVRVISKYQLSTVRAEGGQLHALLPEAPKIDVLETRIDVTRRVE